MLLSMAVAINLVIFTGPDNQRIEINPQSIVSVRKPRRSDHFYSGAQCLMTTIDGKFILVIEDCDTVSKKLKAAGGQ